MFLHLPACACMCQTVRIDILFVLHDFGVGCICGVKWVHKFRIPFFRVDILMLPPSANVPVKSSVNFVSFYVPARRQLIEQMSDINQVMWQDVNPQFLDIPEKITVPVADCP
jgi:hypothetical protein